MPPLPSDRPRPIRRLSNTGPSEVTGSSPLFCHLGPRSTHHRVYGLGLHPTYHHPHSWLAQHITGPAIFFRNQSWRHLRRGYYASLHGPPPLGARPPLDGTKFSLGKARVALLIRRAAPVTPLALSAAPRGVLLWDKLALLILIPLHAYNVAWGTVACLSPQVKAHLQVCGT